MTSLVEKTVNLSLIAQVITTLIGILAVFITIPKKHHILYDILNLETFVQIIEIIFYIYIAFFFTKGVSLSKVDIAKYRYYDWFFTTPTMLFSTLCYFIYNAKMKNSESEILISKKETKKENMANWTEEKDKNTSELTIWNILKTYKLDIFIIGIANFIMLLFGYLKEINVISLFTSTFFGYIFFFISFYYLWKFARLDSSNMPIFITMFVIWALYGVAALFKNKIKNTAYNILDIFAKNFYGVFLAYTIWTLGGTRGT